MPNPRHHILLFTKYPRPGFSKTRLIPALGPVKAAELQRRMTWQTISTITTLGSPGKISLEIHYTGASLEDMYNWLGPDFCYKKQPETSLGNRIERAILPHLQTGSRIVVLGSDCPGITVEILMKAFTSLRNNHVTLGPTHDGGYYLLGITGSLKPQELKTLLSGIPWGSNTVYSKTIKRVTKLQLSHQTLPMLHDIDTPEDLQHISYYPNTQ